MAVRQTVDMEDYLEAILMLKQEQGQARVSTIGEKLGVTMPSVNYALGKLRDAGLVSHESYGEVDLTPGGRKIAEEVYEKHQLLTMFLFNVLGVERDKAEEEACKLEHYMSAETTMRLSSLVSYILLGPRSEAWLKDFRRFHEYGEAGEGRPGRCDGED